MRFLEVKDFTPPENREYDVTVYPGDGAWIDETGQIRVLCDGVIYLMQKGAHKFIREQTEPPSFEELLKDLRKTDLPVVPDPPPAIDPHRLIDQVIRLARAMAR